LPGASLHALRSGAQAHRSNRQRGDGKQFFVAKGAPQVILQMAINVGDVKTAAEKAILDFAGRGFRSLGVAKADEKVNGSLSAFCPLSDPPRADAKETIANAVQMGVKIKMVTGDQIPLHGKHRKNWAWARYPGRQRAWRHKEERVSRGR